MFEDYHRFVLNAYKNPQTLKQFCRMFLYDIQNLLQTFPINFHLKRIQQAIEKDGFNKAVHLYPKLLDSYLKQLQIQFTSKNKKMESSFRQYVLSIMWPSVIMKNCNKNTSQIIARIKLLKKEWNLGQLDCANAIMYFESRANEKQNENGNSNKLFNQILIQFSTNQKELSYKKQGIFILNIAVGEMVYFCQSLHINLRKKYKEVLQKSRKDLNQLLNKIKFKQITFCQILSQITCIDKNKTELDRIKNITQLFLITQAWDRHCEEGSHLKSELIHQLICESFNRLLFSVYQLSGILETKVFVSFLVQSKFSMNEHFKKSICYHLLAIYKIQNESKINQICALIQQIWNTKLIDFRMSQMFISNSFSFLKEEQKIKSFEVENVQSNNQSKRFLSSKKKKLLKNNTMEIQKELKNLYFQKVFLLIIGLKQNNIIKINSSETDSLEKNAILNLLTSIVKICQQKISYRYSCGLLINKIYYQCLDLFQNYYSKQFHYKEIINTLGNYSNCSFENGETALIEFLHFHQAYSAEQSIQNLAKIKFLKRQILKGSLIQKQKISAKQKGFEKMIYELVKIGLKKQNQNEKQLKIIQRILDIKSNHIHYNFLANYIHYILGSCDDTKVLFQKKNIITQILVEQIIGKSIQDLKRVKFLLKMHQIFDFFHLQNVNQSTMIRMSVKPSVSQKYFQFLKRPEHKFIYINFSLAFKELNYLKQSLFFLELHYFQTKNKEQCDKYKITAIELYSRLNSDFHSCLPTILKYQSQIINEANLLTLEKKSSFISVIQHMKFRKYNQSSSLSNKKHYMIIKIGAFLQQVVKLKEAKEINQQFLKICIFLKYMQIQTSKSLPLNQTNKKIFQIVQLVQNLSNSDQQLQFLIFLKQEFHHISSDLQTLYFDKLLKFKKYDTLISEIRQQKKSDFYLPKNKLKYLIYCQFAKLHYTEALALIQIYSKAKENIEQDIKYLKLQISFLMLNYSIEDTLSFISNCIKDKKNCHDKNIHFFLKMFRSIFNRYIFKSQKHNNSFLKIYSIFFDNFNLFKAQQHVLHEVVFYLLRFVLEKFYYNATSSHGKTVLQILQSNTHLIVPHCDYLLQSISNDIERNEIIQYLLKIVLIQHSKDCLWTIAFMKNYDVVRSEKMRISELEKCEKQVIDSIIKYVLEQNQKKQLINKSHLEWIEELISIVHYQKLYQKEEISHKQFSQKINSFVKTSPPSGIPFVFRPTHNIQRIIQMKEIGQGKSCPFEITISLIDLSTKNEIKQFQSIRIILKCNFNSKNYRIQSKTANFFSQIDIFDCETTYRIYHLTKFITLIEYVSNAGTLNSVVTKNLFPEFRKAQSDIHLCKKERRLLDVFDNFYDKTKIPFSNYLYKKCKNIQEWWMKFKNFSFTNAQWSYIGYVIGLGDRHPDNILISEKGKLIHIDFEYVLDAGLKLQYPQWVPFRFTYCLYEPLGILGQYGLFLVAMIQTAKDFLNKQSSIWKALSHFVGSMDTNITVQILERAKFAHLKGVQLEDAICELIKTAKNKQLLRLMFDGWRAYF